MSSSSVVGGIIANLINKQESSNQNLTQDDGDYTLISSPFDTLKLSGELVVTKKVYASDSFILDHPVYGDVDSSVLMIDGGYVSSTVGVAPSDSDCLAYYKFSDLSDEKGNFDLSSNGGSFSSAVIGSGYSTLGGDFYAYNTSLQLSNYSDLSVSGWLFIPSGDTAIHDLYSSSSNSSWTGHWVTVHLSNDTINWRFSAGSSTYNHTTSYVFVERDVFHHIVVTHDEVNSVDKLYIDGLLVDSGVTGSSHGGGYFQIGRYLTSYYHYYRDVIVDELAIFTSVLSQDSVTYLFNNGSPGVSNQYPFVEHEDEVLVDKSF